MKLPAPALPRIVFLLSGGVFFGLMVPSQASAYIGPGAGFAFLGSFFIFFITFLISIAALFAWPVRYLLRLRQGKSTHIKNPKIKKAIVVGFDGMEPTLVERYMNQGLLPHLSRLRSEGTYRHLKSTLPPLSPVAWSTFQTGVNPGKHAIFDFLHRNPNNYLGELSSAQVRPNQRILRIGRFQVPLGRSVVRLLRKSQPFWKILGDYGIFSMILRVPITFPPERFNGLSLAAMCVPDLRGTQGTFSYYTTRPEDEKDRTGGEVIPVQWKKDIIRTRIIGPRHPFRSKETPLTMDLTIIRKDDTQISLQVGSERHILSAGDYTPWVPVSFRADLIKLRGIVRFYLLRTEPYLELYMSPVHVDPAAPSLPLSHPTAFSLYLAKKQGPFATLGLAEDTWALNEGALDDLAFWEQCRSIHQERESMFWDAMDHLRQGLLVCVFDITDRVQHMFWRYEDKSHPAHPSSIPEEMQDPLLQVYKMADSFLGELLEKIDSETLLIVMSDHGFRSFRRCVNINTWLMQNGFLSLDSDQDSGDWFQGVDWSHTKAFALGLAGIYINEKGRESKGTVSPGEEARLIKMEITRKLKGLMDPETGDTAVLDVIDSAAAYKGPYQANAPDLIIGYNAGFRNSWESAVGKVTDEVFYDNKKMWSGDHCLLPDIVPGVLFSNKTLLTQSPHIADLAPTILRAFGIDPPEYMDGETIQFDAGP